MLIFEFWIVFKCSNYIQMFEVIFECWRNVFLVHALEKWRLHMMLARKYHSFTKSYSMLVRKDSCVKTTSSCCKIFTNMEKYVKRFQNIPELKSQVHSRWCGSWYYRNCSWKWNPCFDGIEPLWTSNWCNSRQHL